MTRSKTITLVALVLSLMLLAFEPRVVGDTLESQHWTVLSRAQVEALMEAVSGETARDHIRFITQYWRWAPSRGFREVANYIVEAAKRYGLTDAHVERFIADKATTYSGLSIYRPSWDPIAGELWMVEPARRKITSFADVPMALAGYSRSADVTAEVVDVGDGTSPNDYAGKDVRGKIVLGTGGVGDMQQRAVFERGALGILCAWMPELQTSRDPLDYPDFVSWGNRHVPESPTGQPSTFAFMLSLRQRQMLLDELKKGSKVKVRARVQADLEEPGYLEVATATIPGREAPDQELVFSAHLEHPKPAANDNASGSATLLEIARVLQDLVRSGDLPPPKRTIRFLWVQEGRSTRAFVASHPELAKRAFANINMDIVGNDQEKTKAVVYLWRSAASRPSFISDVVQDFFELVRNTNNERMPTEPLHPIFAPTGNRRPFIGSVERYRRPSDQSNFIGIGVPAVNFAAWPDQFHHTPFDTPDKSDPTQLERMAFIGAASAAALVGAGAQDVPSILGTVVGRGRMRVGEDLTKALRLLDRAGPAQLVEGYKEARNVVQQSHHTESNAIDSIRLLAANDTVRLDHIERQKRAFAESLETMLRHVELAYEIRAGGSPGSTTVLTPTEPELRADRRAPAHTGTYDGDAESVADRFKHHNVDVGRLRIARYSWELNGTFPTLFHAPLQETLNFIDGRRTVKGIRDAVSAEYVPIPLDVMEELFDAMEKAGMVTIKNVQR